MPYTFAHPAAALPFRKTRLVLSAVIVGSMAPDFEFFLVMSPTGRFGHTLVGLVVFTLPAALAVYYLFHGVAKTAVVRLLPNCVQRRLDGGEAFRPRTRREFGLLVASLMTGALTHVGWDSFTHGRSWLVLHWRFLHERVMLPWLSSHPLRVCEVLHFVSTLAGAAIVMLWIASWMRRAEPRWPVAAPLHAVSKVAIALVITMLACGGAWLRCTFLPEPLGPPYVEFFAISWTAVVWWQLVALGWWWQQPVRTAATERLNSRRSASAAFAKTDPS